MKTVGTLHTRTTCLLRILHKSWVMLPALRRRKRLSSKEIPTCLSRRPETAGIPFWNHMIRKFVYIQKQWCVGMWWLHLDQGIPTGSHPFTPSKYYTVHCMIVASTLQDTVSDSIEKWSLPFDSSVWEESNNVSKCVKICQTGQFSQWVKISPQSLAENFRPRQTFFFFIHRRFYKHKSMRWEGREANENRA